MNFGLNQLCLMVIDGRPSRLVRIEHKDNRPGFYQCVDVETSAEYTLCHHNLMPANNIPARFRRTLFEGVAHVIGGALHYYPKAVAVDTHPLVPETFARRIREALQAKRLYGYTHHTINEEQFKRHGDELAVTPRSGQVIVGTLQAIKNHTVMQYGKILTGTKNEIEVTTKTNEDLERLCRILHDKILKPAPQFIVQCTQATADDFESRYDVAFAPVEGDPTRFYLL